MKWFASFFIPSTDWIQIEISTVCNAACIYCPRTTHLDHWQNRFMTRETFQKIVPALSKSNMAYLQGWGEPFLHPDIFKFISLAKQARCLVGTTTNAMSLDSDKIYRLVELGVDIIAFSLAGASEKNDVFRKGTQLNKVLEAIKCLDRIKHEMGASRPSIHIAYMLLRSGLEDIDDLPSLLSGLNIDQVVITTLPYAPSPEMEEEMLCALQPVERQELKTRLQAIAEKAKRMGVPINYYLRDSDNSVSVCTENIEKALFISVNGEVSPCVFTRMPLNNPLKKPEDEKHTRQQIVFGDINRQSFKEIWNQKDYRDFRNSCSSGQLSQSCRHCPKRHEILF